MSVYAHLQSLVVLILLYIKWWCPIKYVNLVTNFLFKFSKKKKPQMQGSLQVQIVWVHLLQKIWRFNIQLSILRHFNYLVRMYVFINTLHWFLKLQPVSVYYTIRWCCLFGFKSLDNNINNSEKNKKQWSAKAYNNNNQHHWRKTVRQWTSISYNRRPKYE